MGGSCVAKNSQRPASVETVQGGVPPYGVKDTLVVNGKCSFCTTRLKTHFVIIRWQFVQGLVDTDMGI